MSVKVVLKNTVFYAVANAFQKGFSFLLLFVVALFLSPEEYGYLALIHVFSYFAQTIVTSTVHGSILRFYVDLEGEERKRFIGSVLTFTLSFGLLLFLVVTLKGQALVSALFPKSSFGFYPLYALSLGIVFFTIPQPMVNSIFRIKEKPRYIVTLVIVNSLANATFISLFLILLRQGLEGLLRGQLLAAILIFCFYFYLIRNEYLLKFDWRLLKPALIFSFPLMPYLFLEFLRGRAGIYILEKSVEAGQIGIYYFGANLGFAMSAIVSTFAAAYSPRMFILLKEKPLETAKEEFKKIFLYIYLLMLIGFVGLSLFSEEIIYLFFRQKYTDSYVLIPIIALSCFLGGVYLFFHNSFYWTKKTFYVSLCALIMTTTTVVSQFLLIPKISIMGAAIGLLVGAIAGLASGYIWGQKVFRMNYEFKKLLLISASAVTGVFGIAYLLPQGLFLWKIAGKLFLVFFIFWMALGITRIDFKTLLTQYRTLLRPSSF